jgi:thymidylate synthase
MNREPFPFPTLTINKMKENINDYQIQDFEINNYQHHEQIYYKMIA